MCLLNVAASSKSDISTSIKALLDSSIGGHDPLARAQSLSAVARLCGVSTNV